MTSITFDDLTMPYVFSLRLIGVLPYKGRKFNYFGSRLSLLYFLIVCLFYFNMFLAYPISCLIQGIVELDKICEFVVCCSICIRYLILIPHRDELVYMFKDLSEIWQHWNEDEKRTVMTFERKVRGYWALIFFAVAIINCLYCILALSVKQSPFETNGTARRGLPAKWYTEIDSNTISYKLLFIAQSVTIQSIGVLMTGLETVVPSVVMIISGYLRVLQNRFFNAYEEERPSKSIIDYYDYVVVWSRIHQNILNICMRVEKVSRILFMVQLLGTAYIISMIGIELLGDDPSKYRLIPVLGVCAMQMYICQWAPNYLLEESAGISTAAYFASFPCLSRQVSQNMTIIITRAQRPFQMTASGVVKLSLETYSSMVTSTLSFFTVLRNFKH